jgi:hypothetical protein
MNGPDPRGFGAGGRSLGQYRLGDLIEQRDLFDRECSRLLARSAGSRTAGEQRCLTDERCPA